MTTFEKRHYKKVAQAIRIARKRLQGGDIGVAMIDYAIVDSLSDMFKEDNPKFDKQSFLKAAGAFSMEEAQTHGKTNG